MPDAPSTKDSRYLKLAFRIIGEFGVSIAVPVVVLALLGKHLDERFGTGPWLRIAGFALAAVITALIVSRRAKAFGKEYEAIDKEGAPKQQ